MTGENVYLLIVISFSFSTVLGNHQYFFEHYFNKYHHHKSSSIIPSISSTIKPSISSTSDIPTSDPIIPLNKDVEMSEENSSLEDDKDDFSENTTLQHSGEYDPAQYIFVTRVVIIVGSLIFVVFVLGCIVCCCPKCCRGERRGFIVRDNARNRNVPPECVVTQPPEQPAIVQHIPPGYTQEPVQQLPPQYQQPVLPSSQYPPMQPQSQYYPVQPQPHYSPMHQGYTNPSTTLQFYNPPEAPPPYEPTAPKYNT